MNRDVSVERVFNLGDYKSIRFSDVVRDLPQEVVFNQELVGKIRFLQMVEIEQSFFRYQELRARLESQPDKESLNKFLEDLKLNTLEEIKGLLNGYAKE